MGYRERGSERDGQGERVRERDTGRGSERGGTGRRSERD